MPLHLNESQDKITAITSFMVSPVLEMLVSLQAFAHPWRVRKWTEEVTNIMGKNFKKDLSDLYQSHNLGCDFIELAIDFTDQKNIPAFIKHLREMPVKQFIFYLLGRIIPLKAIPENGDLTKINKLISTYMDTKEQCESCLEPGKIENINLVKEQLPNLLEEYWEKYLKIEMPDIYNVLEESIQDKENFLIRNGGINLLKKITNHNKLPSPMPENIPYSSVRFIPIFRMHRSSQLYYGYGNATILYDANLNDNRTTEIQQLKTSVLTTMKALGDENRLKILQIIADAYQKLNGKMIAEKLDLSQSVVSRHLGQLKEAGLISEFSPDKRNITYSVEWESIETIESRLLEFMEAE